MKKIFLLVSLFAATFSANAENIISVTPFATQPGVETDEETIFFEIAMNNDKKFTAFYFDLYLPEGLSIATDNKGNILFDLSEDRFEGTTKKGVFIPDANCSIEDMGDGHYFISLYDEDLQKIKGTSGTLMYLYFNTADEMVPGYYPITIKSTKIAVDSNPANGTVIDGDVTSYVKVGDPTNATLALTGEIPSFVNAALASETAITTLNLSGVTASNGTFTYVDGREVVEPATEVVADLQFVRNTTDYYSINLPFASTSVEGNVYGFDMIASIEDDDNYYFDEATSTEKDETYLAIGEVTIKGHGAIEGISKKTNQKGAYVYENTMYDGSNLTVKPTRGLFLDWSEKGSSSRRIVINGTLTDINAAAIDAQSDNTYDLQGRQVQNAKNGVFVVNGKKQFVK